MTASNTNFIQLDLADAALVAATLIEDIKRFQKALDDGRGVFGLAELVARERELAVRIIGEIAKAGVTVELSIDE